MVGNRGRPNIVRAHRAWYEVMKPPTLPESDPGTARQCVIVSPYLRTDNLSCLPPANLQSLPQQYVVKCPHQPRTLSSAVYGHEVYYYHILLLLDTNANALEVRTVHLLIRSLLRHRRRICSEH